MKPIRICILCVVFLSACIPGGGQEGSSTPPAPTDLPPSTLEPTMAEPSNTPMFSAPADWETYSNANPPYEIQYPPDAILDAQPERLTINLPFSAGTTMIEKSVWVETRLASPDECFGLIPWRGTVSLNGVDFQSVEEPNWQLAMGGLSFLMNMYATAQDGFCFYVSLRVGRRDDSGMTGATPLPTPNQAETDMGILFDIFHTLQIR